MAAKPEVMVCGLNSGAAATPATTRQTPVLLHGTNASLHLQDSPLPGFPHILSTHKLMIRAG